MAAGEEDFGEWRTAPDGQAHYVLGGKCLCGAKVKSFGGPPRRDQPPAGPPRKYITPLCEDCMTVNYIRWAKKGGKSEELLTAWLDRRHRREFRPRRSGTPRPR